MAFPPDSAEFSRYPVAISVAAVLFVTNGCIGIRPGFLVKAIADPP